MNGKSVAKLLGLLSSAILVFLVIVSIFAFVSLQGGATEAWPRSVLITNDDGLESEGLQALVRTFAPQLKTYVVAPLENRSGSTNYLSAFARRSMAVERRDLGDGVVAFAVDGYPADAVALALHGLIEPRPDIVISGVNSGPNLAGAWNLSGTVGAAQIAAFFGVPAIAVSGYSDSEPETLEAAARWILWLGRSPLMRELEPGGYLTVSIPRLPISEITGVDVVPRGTSDWRIAFEAAADSSPDGRSVWNFSLVSLDDEPQDGTDRHVYAHGRIAVVPMRVDEHDYELLESLRRQPDRLPSWPPARAR